MLSLSLFKKKSSKEADSNYGRLIVCQYLRFADISERRLTFVCRPIKMSSNRFPFSQFKSVCPFCGKKKSFAQLIPAQREKWFSFSFSWNLVRVASAEMKLWTIFEPKKMVKQFAFLFFPILSSDDLTYDLDLKTLSNTLNFRSLSSVWNRIRRIHTRSTVWHWTLWSDIEFQWLEHIVCSNSIARR